MSTTGDPMTVRFLLFGSDEADAGELLARSVEDRGLGASVGAAIGGLTTQGKHAVCDEVGHVADSLLNLDITDVLFAAWRKQSALVAAGYQTLADPGSEELVELATHTITAKHRPHVDVYVDDVEITRVDIELALRILVRGMLGVVADGRLVAIRAGTCEVTGSLSCEGVQLVQRTAEYDLPGEVRLGSGIDLVRQRSAPVSP